MAPGVLENLWTPVDHNGGSSFLHNTDMNFTPYYTVAHTRWLQSLGSPPCSGIAVGEGGRGNDEAAKGSRFQRGGKINIFKLKNFILCAQQILNYLHN